MRRDDDFSPKTIETLAKRVGYRCSNPDCPKLTIGPHTQPTKTVNIGVAAHITAAAPGGKRYDASLSSEHRKSIENGMWLCQNCGKLIDSDEQKYSVDLLMSWKREAEQQASSEIENSMSPVSKDISSGFEQYLQNLIDQRQVWWLDEINDSTWYEFELFTKVQGRSEQPGGGNPQELPKPLLQAIEDGKKRSILITGAPGSGKSTFLEKLALEAARKAQESNAPIPVLVRLKDYESSGEQPGIRGLIQSALESYDPSLDSEATQQLLQGKDRTLLLLIDGWNELSDEKAKSKIKTFCQPHSVIVTSRNAGDYSEIQQKFEIQPLSRSDVEGFFEKRLPNIERKRLQELVDRVQDFGQTPLMVWMLFSIFRNDDPIPKTRGEAYRAFTAIYAKRAKAGVDLSEARKLLGKLAFEMMKSPNPKDPTEFRSKVPEVEAGEILGSEAELDRMLNHLLNHQGREGIREISFCHQSLQEYYAAEHLRLELVQHPEWREKQANEEYSWLQHHYLNYTKWTEPIALMLGLCEENTAVPIVEQALGVDLMLGARLAGEVRPTWVESAIRLVKQIECQNWLKYRLFGESRSRYTVSDLLKGLEESETRSSAAAALIKIGKAAMPDLLQAIEHTNPYVRLSAAEILGVCASECEIPALLKIAENPRDNIPEYAIYALGKIRSDLAISGLQKWIQDPRANVRQFVAGALGDIGSENAFKILMQLAEDLEPDVRKSVANALGSIPSELAISILLNLTQDTNDDVRQCCINSIGRIRLRASTIALLKISASPDPSVNFRAAFMLKYCSVESSIDLLMEALENKKSSVREGAIQALGNLRAELAVPKLIQEIGNPDVQISTTAIQALGKIKSKESVSALLGATSNPHPFIRADTIEALGEIRAEEAIPNLLMALEDAYSDVRLVALQALENIAIQASGSIKEEIISHLQNELQDPNPDVRLQTLEVLTTLGDEKAIPLLVEAFRNADTDKRQKAAGFALAEANCQELLTDLLNMLTVTNTKWISDALGKFKGDLAANILPTLVILFPTQSGEEALRAIQAIQANCKFYNYEIFHSPPAKPHPTQQSPPPVTYNINQVGNLNTGTVNIQGHQIGKSPPT